MREGVGSSYVTPAAFLGQTLHEMCLGTAAELAAVLAAIRDLARAVRLAANRGMSFDRRLDGQVTPTESDTPA
jgi:hypothetical protein